LFIPFLHAHTVTNTSFYALGAQGMAKIEIDEHRCKGCGLCTTVCPHNLLVLKGKLNAQGYAIVEISDASQCIGCALCAKICPDVAILVYK
jgi:2-oxoglutarate ferredoxin oxidoreductase subunit delta